MVRIPGGAGPTLECTNPSWRHLCNAGLPSVGLLSVGKEEKEEKKMKKKRKKQRAKGKCTVAVVGGGDDVTGLSGNTALLKSRKKHPDPHLSHPHPGASHTHTELSYPQPRRGKKPLHPITECTGKNVSELWFAFPTC